MKDFYIHNDKTYFFLYSFTILIISYCIFFSNYHFPADLYWDENYHIAFAYKYFHNTFYQEIHPPLGKLLIAAGEKIWNVNSDIDTSLIGTTDHLNHIPPNFSFKGLRFFPALFAFLSGYIFFLILCLLLQNLHLAVLLSSLYIFENSLIVHFRGAMLDGIQMFFVLCSICLVIWIWRKNAYKSMNYYLLGILVGLAVSCKFNALILNLLFVFLIFFDSKIIFKSTELKSWQTISFNFLKKGFVFVLGLVMIFSLIQYIHLQFAGDIKKDEGYFINDTFRNAAKEGNLSNPYYTLISLADWYEYAKSHTGKMPKLNPCNPDENGSHPAGWIIGRKPINYRWIKYYDSKDYHSTYLNSSENKSISMEDHSKLKPSEKSKYSLVVRYLNLIGNPAVWLLGLISIILSISLIVSTVVYGLKIKNKETFALILLFLCMYICYMITVISAVRVLYLYTYYMPLVFSMILTVLNFKYLFQDQIEHKQNQKIVYTCVILGSVLVFAAFIFYAPLTYYMPLTEEEFQARNLFKYWEMKSVK